MKLSFTKMQGCANDYIYLDCRKSGVPENIAALSEKLSRRHFSIGADGIICICAAQTAGADGMMRIFNADGSEGRMCGNGIRCVAEWLYTHGIAKETLAIDTLSGLKTVTHKGAGLWQVEMGAYSAMPASLPAVNMGEEPLVDKELTVDGKTWHVTCISVGNPHCVTVVEDVDSLKLEEIGPAFEHHANFPERINTEFVQVVDPTHLKMRHRHLRHRGGPDRAWHLPGRRGHPCAAARRCADHPGIARQTAADDRRRRDRVRRHDGSVRKTRTLSVA
jgi:diaminopimelate epimerase